MTAAALGYALMIVGPIAGAAIVVIFRPWQLIPRRRAPRYAPRHAPRDMTPAEVEEWLAEVAPDDPGAASPAPEAAAHAPAPVETAAAGADPAPVPPRPGAGQHPSGDSRPSWYVLTRDEVADYRHGPVRVYGTAWHGHVTETGAQAALVRPAARRHFDHVERWWEQ